MLRLLLVVLGCFALSSPASAQSVGRETMEWDANAGKQSCNRQGQEIKETFTLKATGDRFIKNFHAKQCWLRSMTGALDPRWTRVGEKKVKIPIKLPSGDEHILEETTEIAVELYADCGNQIVHWVGKPPIEARCIFQYDLVRYTK
ncbi:MAG: hypothetical protein NW223_10045 [Hyphomicrobiaceae bacterium]|nr:hypothetical protein [Hyphomicrobiaceae bacterium]